MTGLFGIYRASVVQNDDPEKRLRIRVRVPSVTGRAVTDWAWPCVAPGPHVTAPAVGKGVWVMYENGSVDHLVWVGVFEEQLALQPPKPHPHSHSHTVPEHAGQSGDALTSPS